jgi:hypothetical protein
MTELAEIRGLVELALKGIGELRDALEEKKADLTVTEFAKRIGRHPNTVHRWIADGQIKKGPTGIPYRELRRYLS